MDEDASEYQNFFVASRFENIGSSSSPDQKPAKLFH
jgi:hypothetical protein